AVRRGAQCRVILEVALHAVVEDSPAAADNQSVVLERAPGEVQAWPHFDGWRIEHAFLDLSTSGGEHTVRTERIAVDVISGSALVSARAEESIESLALKVGGQVRDAQTCLQSEVRAHLPRILGIELVVVEAIVANRRLCALLHVGELSDQQICKVGAGAIPV